MVHRHLTHSSFTLAAVDDIIARGNLADWRELRDAAHDHSDIRQRIVRVCQPRLGDPYEQRYHFWNNYVSRHLA